MLGECLFVIDKFLSGIIWTNLEPGLIYLNIKSNIKLTRSAIMLKRTWPVILSWRDNGHALHGRVHLKWGWLYSQKLIWKVINLRLMLMTSCGSNESNSMTVSIIKCSLKTCLWCHMIFKPKLKMRFIKNLVEFLENTELLLRNYF